MGKGATKKGKQKEPANAPPGPPPSPPPALVASPPAAHHIPHPSAIIDTIQEEGLEGQGGPAGSGEDGSWQDIGQSGADSWGADVPGNSNDSEDLGEDGWETDLPQAPIPMPSPQPPAKNSGGQKDARSHHPQLQLRIPSNPQNSKGPTANPSAHKSSAGSWGYAQPHPHVTWNQEEDEWLDEPAEDDGGNGWGGTGDAWGQQPHSAAWAHAVSVHSTYSQAPSQAPTAGWQSWSEEARKLPKVTFDPAIPSSPSSSGSKPVLSQTQRSRILNELLNNPQQNQQLYPMPPNPLPTVASITHHQHGNQYQQHHRPRQSSGRQYGQGARNLGSEPLAQHQARRTQSQSQSHGRRHQEEVHDAWGLGGGWNDLQTDDEEQDIAQDPWGRRVHFSPSTRRASMPQSVPSVAPSAVVENITVNALPQNKLGISTIPMSKTLSYAYSGSTPSAESEPGRVTMQRITDFHFAESRGEALKSVQNAFYGKRKATDRFYWSFPPEKDERVSSLLSWINTVSFGIASFGLQKFLQTRERGALMVNAAYQSVHSPNEPVFDWITWNEIQRTMDRILQESVGYYNPAVHIILFVLLPSPSGNSVAIWRRKLPIPNNIRLAYQAQLTQALASLRKEYPVLVDELPHPPEPSPPPPPPKKKRKWYKLWLFS